MAPSLGGRASYDSVTGTLSGAACTVNGTSYGNVGQALSGLAAQLGSATATGVTYDWPWRDRVTLTGQGGTIIGIVGSGTVAAGSMEALNGGQLAATNAKVAANSAAGSATALTTAQQAATVSANSVQYDSASNTVTFTHPADFTATEPVTLRNVAASVAMAQADAAVEVGIALR